jgi:hypothetical protein
VDQYDQEEIPQEGINQGAGRDEATLLTGSDARHAGAGSPAGSNPTADLAWSP